MEKFTTSFFMQFKIDHEKNYMQFLTSKGSTLAQMFGISTYTYYLPSKVAKHQKLEKHYI